MNKWLFIAAACVLTSMSAAQSLNVDFNWNTASSVPSNAYAAAGLAGAWNNGISDFPISTITNMTLKDLSGTVIPGATLSVTSFTTSCAVTGPWSGDDFLFMQDTIGATTPGSMSFGGLANGTYDVYVYGQNSSGNSTSTFTIGSTTLTTGGAWTGSHVLGGSYNKFSGVAVTSGNMSVRWTGNNNGIQLVQTVPEPISCATLATGLIALVARRRRSA